MIQKIEYVKELDELRDTAFACRIHAAADSYGVETPPLHSFGSRKAAPCYANWMM